MTVTTSLKTLAIAGLLSASMCISANAAVVVVDSFGDSGWRSDDTRDSTGVNLVGINNTNAGKPGQVPTAGDDAAIAAQIKFIDGPAGSTYGGAVSIDGTATGSGKSNFSVIDTSTGFAPASDLLTPGFSANYQFYKQHTGGGSTLAFKLGIQSTAWGTGIGQSQNGFTAARSGESAWDLVLVHVPFVAVPDNNTWRNVSLDHDSGDWTLFRQAGNGNLSAPPANPFAQSLDLWAQDATWGPLLFGAGAKVTSVQFGLGSSQPVALGLVDYLQTSLLNGGDVIDFAAVPEPTSIVLLGMAGSMGLAAARRRARG